jgi:hypothetical protein
LDKEFQAGSAARLDVRLIARIHWPVDLMECFQAARHLPMACIFRAESAKRICLDYQRRGLFSLYAPEVIVKSFNILSVNIRNNSCSLLGVVVPIGLTFGIRLVDVLQLIVQSDSVTDNLII